MEEQKKQGGKKPGQKFKSLLVWDILQKRTDENHAIQLKEIVEHLKMYGITAERHSIKRDIDDILALLNRCSICLIYRTFSFCPKHGIPEITQSPFDLPFSLCYTERKNEGVFDCGK